MRKKAKKNNVTKKKLLDLKELYVFVNENIILNLSYEIIMLK
jgi:hypothetical protein